MLLLSKAPVHFVRAPLRADVKAPARRVPIMRCLAAFAGQALTFPSVSRAVPASTRSMPNTSVIFQKKKKKGKEEKEKREKEEGRAIGLGEDTALASRPRLEPLDKVLFLVSQTRWLAPLRPKPRSSMRSLSSAPGR